MYDEEKLRKQMVDKEAMMEKNIARTEANMFSFGQNLKATLDSADPKILSLLVGVLAFFNFFMNNFVFSICVVLFSVWCTYRIIKAQQKGIQREKLIQELLKE